MNGPGYVEAGGSYSSLTNQFSSWRDGYLRGAFSGGNNLFGIEVTRQSRYRDSGWYGSGSWTRTLNSDWYTNMDLGSSAGGFFIPKLRVDGFINRKLLPSKRLVLSGGIGYDKSKIANSALRGQFGGMYYFERPFILQGEVTWTRASPGDILARSQSLAITEGRDKEHYVSFRAEFGREAYELVGPRTSLFDFAFHNFSANWRQWVGVNWGLNMAYDYENNLAFHRYGGTFGLFMDF